MTDKTLQRKIASAGASLFAVGMFTGLWAGVVLADKVKVPIPHMALAAHLNALLGCFWLVALSATVPHLRYGITGKKRLFAITLLPTWGNWLVTLIASVIGARGLEFTGDHGNDFIAASLLAVVVAPALIASTAWAYGLFGNAPSEVAEKSS